MLKGRIPAQMEDPQWISSARLIEITGITERQLNYWIKKGFIDPEGGGGDPENNGGGRGRPRKWSKADVEIVRDMLRRIEECPFDHNQ